MAILVGDQTADDILGTDEDDVIFGDPYTTGNDLGVPEVGGSLTSARGGNDTIESGAGEDWVIGDAWSIGQSGRGGRDVIRGGADDDILHGDARELEEDARGGNDRIFGDGGSDTILGEGAYLQDDAVGGKDFIKGGAGDDVITGDASVVSGQAVGGADKLYGGGGNDTLRGDAIWLADATGGDDLLNGGGGNDTLVGDGHLMYIDAPEGGDDRLYGGNGADYLYGDALTFSQDVIAGDDFLEGGRGADHLWGDARELQVTEGYLSGADTFYFATRSGLDVIHDFEQGKDLIDVSGYAIGGFSDLAIDDDGVDTFVDLGASAGGAAGRNVVTVEGVLDLTADDFAFA